MSTTVVNSFRENYFHSEENSYSTSLIEKVKTFIKELFNAILSGSLKGLRDYFSKTCESPERETEMATKSSPQNKMTFSKWGKVSGLVDKVRNPFNQDPRFIPFNCKYVLDQDANFICPDLKRMHFIVKSIEDSSKVSSNDYVLFKNNKDEVFSIDRSEAFQNFDYTVDFLQNNGYANNSYVRKPLVEGASIEGYLKYLNDNKNRFL